MAVPATYCLRSFSAESRPPCLFCQCRGKTCWQSKVGAVGRHPLDDCNCECAFPTSMNSWCHSPAPEGVHALPQEDRPLWQCQRWPGAGWSMPGKGRLHWAGGEVAQWRLRQWRCQGQVQDRDELRTASICTWWVRFPRCTLCKL